MFGVGDTHMFWGGCNDRAGLGSGGCCRQERAPGEGWAAQLVLRGLAGAQ